MGKAVWTIGAVFALSLIDFCPTIEAGTHSQIRIKECALPYFNYKDAIMISSLYEGFQTNSVPENDEDSDEPPQNSGFAAPAQGTPVSAPAGKHPLYNSTAKLLILFCTAMIVTVCLLWIGTRPLFLSDLWGKELTVAFQILFVLFALALIWRVVLFLRYRPAPLFSDEKLPTCGVIVPAYNEGRQVLNTLRSIAQSDYPERKLKIVAVDDGSKDDTWVWIQQASSEMPGRITCIRLSRNQGKRRALFAGFKHCRSDVFVTIDSDSQVTPQTLRHLVSPFIENPEVGAVAGNVRILNREEGIIPRMLDVSFAFAFDFLRAGQSMVNTVMCTPGALSAYRSDLVRRVLFQWIHQKFLGRPANIGEDRAMTNMILKLGYSVHFQTAALVYTKAPTEYRGLCRMFLRWARSNVRETLVMSRFVFTRFRKGPMLGARLNLLLGLMNLSIGQCMKLVMLGFLIFSPQELGVRMLFGAVLTGLLPALFFAYRYRSSDALWSL